MRKLELPGIGKVKSGKVREMFEVGGDRLLMVATDRISAFDVVLPDVIPGKGKILNQISAFWFARTRSIVENHLISIDLDDFPPTVRESGADLEGRSALVRKCRPLPVECVVRGYLAGSGWKEYQAHGSICGIRLPGGLRESEELPEPIFTPAEKSETGHDENIDFDQVVRTLGPELAERTRHLSLLLYDFARAFARSRGILICDTKFEFGLDGDRLLLIDEALTPDSSRFWPLDQYRPGRSQPSFDKQYIRDYLETLDWDKRPPGPSLPDAVIEATAQRYAAAFRTLTGSEPRL